MARLRDPAGFAALEEAAGPTSVSVSSTRRAMLQVAVIMAVKGGMAGDVTVGDCLELLEARARALAALSAEIVECRRCRLIRLFPQPEPAELAKYYPPGYWFNPKGDAADRLEEVYRRLALRDHLRFVRRALADAKGAGVVLDVGCGGGLFLGMLAEGGTRVVGLDFSLDAASVAWQRQQVPAVCATLARAPFAPGSCAAITMFHVLEHLYDPAAYIEAAICQGCGSCVAECPAQAIQLLHYTDAQMVSKVQALLEPAHGFVPVTEIATSRI